MDLMHGAGVWLDLGALQLCPALLLACNMVLGMLCGDVLQ